MTDEALGSAAPVVSVRPGRNRLADEDRAVLEERRRRRHAEEHDHKDTNSRNPGASHGRGGESFHDDISVFGIPKEDMTEPVRKAIELLLGQINDLRAELISAHGHEAYLEDRVETDRLLHVMRRKAFVARLAMAARRAAEEHTLFCVLYFSIENAAAVRLKLGDGAVENMMIHASEILHKRLETGDIIGSLEHFDFGLVLPGTQPTVAIQKGRHLVADMAAHTFVWQGQSMCIQARFGMTEIAPGDSGDDIIDRARRVMEATSPAV